MRDEDNQSERTAGQPATDAPKGPTTPPWSAASVRAEGPTGPTSPAHSALALHGLSADRIVEAKLVSLKIIADRALTLSSAAMTASSVSPNLTPLWHELDAEIAGLRVPVLQALADGTIPWQNVGLTEPVAEQLAGAGSDIAKVVASFAKSRLSEADKKKDRLLRWAGIIVGCGGWVVALIVWLNR